MAQNILEQVRSNRAFDDCKSALREIGCPICDVNDVTDIADTIRKHCCTGPNAVINATLCAGPGIKVTPIERRGYKISADDRAEIHHDIDDDIRKGSSINKALRVVVNEKIPAAIKEAVQSPVISEPELVKVPCDGIDYYNNPFFGREGSGRKTGLHRDAWYIRIYTIAAKEPLYVDMCPMVCDLKQDILAELRRELDLPELGNNSGCHCGTPCDPKPETPGTGCDICDDIDKYIKDELGND